MKVIRWILGKIILLIEAMFSPKGVTRPGEEQAKIEEQVSRLSLYQFATCPFCVKVRFAMKRLSLPIETRDANNNMEYKQELMEQGGKHKVPCLKIEEEGGVVKWLYESSAIIQYLEGRFAV